MARRTIVILVALAGVGCGSDQTSNPNGVAPGGGAGGPGALAAGTGAAAGTSGAAGMQSAGSNAAGTLASVGRGVAGAPVAGSGISGTGAGAAAGMAGAAGASSVTAGSGGLAGIPAAGGVGQAGGAGDAMPAAGSGGSSGTPATGTFPVADPAATGPYTPVTVSNTGPSGAYTLFHPQQLAPDGALHPIVSWGNGGATTPADYPQLPHLASHGFVVIGSNNPVVSSAEIKAGIDWIVERNADSSSPFHQKLDVTKIAGVAYSAGGLATLGTADDPRFTTIVIISGANTTESARSTNMPKLHTPIAYLCTSDDASKNNCANDYAVVKVPSFFGVMNGTTHFDVTTFLNVGVAAIINRVGGVTTEWLRWQLMADTSLKSRFVGADCGLCNDTNWTVEPQKNLN